MPYQVVTLPVNSPAAGVDFSFIPCGTDKVRLLTLTATLTTSAVVANRRPALAFSDKSAGTFWSADAINPQVASLAVTYSWARGVGAQVASAIVTTERAALQLPDMWLQGQDTIKSITGAIDVGDQWSNIIFRAVVGEAWESEREMLSVVQALLGPAGG